METVAAHKTFEFQEYQLRELPLLVKKLQKFAIFFQCGNLQTRADWGQIW